MYNKLLDKKAKIAVIGLGYVGLPIALEFAKKVSVIGFDIKQNRVTMMQNRIDPSSELKAEDFEGTDIKFTATMDDLREANFFIVAVPTPIDEHRLPDLKPLLSATETVAKVLKKGDYVVYESTVYPSCTEEDCVPILEKFSGLKFIEDFKVGFSPERINPGDKVNTLTKIKKITSGCDLESAENIAKTYEIIIEAGVHRASSIKVAEAAKIIENTQRDINIAFMNELSILFNKLGINTYEVLEAAGTKWNFLKFNPGLVGGHCIGVDPYYLVHKANELGYHPQMMTAGRAINDSMAAYIAGEIVKKLLGAGKDVRESKVLILGITFKENVSDIRNSKIADLYNELQAFKLEVQVADIHASEKEVFEEYGISLNSNFEATYDAIIVAVNHKEYTNLPFEFFDEKLSKGGLIFDVKGSYRNKLQGLHYVSL
ncbi:MAG TPA: nucleotide sugar dehydrogenase [Bacteroidales bacterium]|nr:nucleotide sugar dehydrogenase [Bacteroidales bacterium]